MHGVTEAQRKVHTESDMKGLIKPLIAADLEWGGMWVNMCMDLIILHRYANHPEWKTQTHLHTVKIKEEWSGGKRTMKDDPVILTLNNGGKDFFGFWDKNNVNPFYNYAKINNLGVTEIRNKTQQQTEVENGTREFFNNSLLNKKRNEESLPKIDEDTQNEEYSEVPF